MIHDLDRVPGRCRGLTQTLLTGGRAARPNGDVTALRAVVLVEGISDRVALHTLAERRGRNLAAEGVPTLCKPEAE